MVNSKSRNNKLGERLIVSALPNMFVSVSVGEFQAQAGPGSGGGGLLSMSSYIIWHTAGSNIPNCSDKMANTSSRWDAVQCVGRLKHLFSIHFKNTKRT